MGGSCGHMWLNYYAWRQIKHCVDVDLPLVISVFFEAPQIPTCRGNRVFKIIGNGFDDLLLPTVYEKNSHIYQPNCKSILIRNAKLPKQAKKLVDMHKFI